MSSELALYYSKLNDYTNIENPRQIANLLSLEDAHVKGLIQRNLSVRK
jgi:hypothetical protein